MMTITQAARELGIVAIITPPVGINVYVTQGVARGVPLETVFRGVLPFLVPFAVAVVLIIAFPQVATFLPSFISY